MKKQIVVIHGGDTFDTYEEYLLFLNNWQIDFEEYSKGSRKDGSRKDWKRTLEETLGEEFEVILPSMPNKINAKYSEWKIWFEKFIPFLEQEVVLIGGSLGGIFLAKYLSENEFQKKVRATFLIAAPYDDKDSEESVSDFALPGSLNKLHEQGGKIFLYHSEDDPVVPFVDLGKYRKDLPNATARVFKDRGHFTQEEFLELVEDIKALY